MENRELVAYVLLAIIAAALFFAYCYGTRDRRIHRRAVKSSEKGRRRERAAASRS
jgi:Flp pilus assembly protein TadB